MNSFNDFSDRVHEALLPFERVKDDFCPNCKQHVLSPEKHWVDEKWICHPEEQYWVMKSGGKIKIKNMSDYHLVCSLNMLQRNVGLENLPDIYYLLAREAYKRGLTEDGYIFKVPSRRVDWGGKGGNQESNTEK